MTGNRTCAQHEKAGEKGAGEKKKESAIAILLRKCPHISRRLLVLSKDGI